MNQRLAYVTVLVDDYDEAIEYFTGKLNFNLVEDTVISDTKRWVLVRPPAEKSCCLLLAKAVNETQKSFIGKQTGGRVFLFLMTDDFNRDYKNLLEKGVEIEREPVEEEYGKVVVFKDLYGNLWDLIEPSKKIGNQ